MEVKDDQSPAALIKELARLVREQLPESKERHYMMNILTGLSSHVYLLENRVEALEDELSELTFQRFAQ